MSRYTVVSLPEAEDELASIWMDDKDRKQIAAAANDADRLLAEDPLWNSVHLSEQLQRRDFSPLRFYFEVQEADRIVVISSVARLPD